MSGKPLTQLATLISVVDRPGAALADILARPRWRWALPCALMIAVLGAAALCSAPLLAVSNAQEVQSIAGQLSQLTAEQADQVQRQLVALQTPAAQGVIHFATNVIGFLFTWLAQGLIIYMIALMAGADITLSPLLAAVPWFSIPSLLEVGISSAYVLHSQRLVANQGLSSLLSSGDRVADAGNLGYAVLSQASIFRLWHLILIYALFRTALRFGRGSAIWLTALYAAVAVGIALAFAALSRLVAPGL